MNGIPEHGDLAAFMVTSYKVNCLYQNVRVAGEHLKFGITENLVRDTGKIKTGNNRLGIGK